MLFYVITGALVGLGLFLILCDLFRIPTRKTTKALMGIEKQYNKKESKINSSLDEVAIWISKRIHLRDHTKAQMEADMNTARMSGTPERFVATCLVKAAVIGVIGLLLIPVLPLASVAVLAYAVIYYFILIQGLKRQVNAHRDAIEMELGQFIFTISRVLQRNRNVLQMLENYREIAGPEMKQEMDITLADMRSGNYEQAISRLEIRVGSVLMSDVCRGLISVIRGDDTYAYWVSLQQKFSEHQRELLKRKADRIPPRVNRLSMLLLFCFVAVWLGILIVQMAASFMEMFSVI